MVKSVDKIAAARTQEALGAGFQTNGKFLDSRGNDVGGINIKGDHVGYFDFAARKLVIAEQRIREQLPTAIVEQDMRKPTPLELGRVRCNASGEVFVGGRPTASVSGYPWSRVDGRAFAIAYDARFDIPASDWRYYVFDITEPKKGIPLVGCYDMKDWAYQL
jgi:hypothetical protein